MHSSTDDIANYWKHVAVHAVQQHEEVIQAQRDEIQELQRKCQELQYERTMMRASNAMDFRDFCLVNTSHGSVPLSSILMFLHNASDGLVPPPENVKKRQRVETPRAPPSPVTRAMQRLMFLNRKLVREGDDEQHLDREAFKELVPS